MRVASGIQEAKDTLSACFMYTSLLSQSCVTSAAQVARKKKEISVAESTLLRPVCDDENKGMGWCRICKGLSLLKTNSRKKEDLKRIQVQVRHVSFGEQDNMYDVKDEALEPFKNVVALQCGSSLLGSIRMIGMKEVGV